MKRTKFKNVLVLFNALATCLMLCFFSSRTSADDLETQSLITKLMQQNETAVIDLKKSTFGQRRTLSQAMMYSCQEALKTLNVSTIKLPGPSSSVLERAGIWVRRILGFPPIILVAPNQDSNLNQLASDLEKDSIRLAIDPTILVGMRATAAHVYVPLLGRKSSFIIVGPYHMAQALAGRSLIKDRFTVHERGHAELAAMLLNKTNSDYSGYIGAVVGVIPEVSNPGRAKALSVEELYVGPKQIEAGIEHLQELLQIGDELEADELLQYLTVESGNLYEETKAIKASAELFLNAARGDTKNGSLFIRSIWNRNLGVRESVATLTGPDENTGKLRILLFKYPLIGIDRITKNDLKTLLIQKWQIARDVAVGLRKPLIFLNYELNIASDRFSNLDTERKKLVVDGLMKELKAANFSKNSGL